ncbi:ABC transporter permease [Sporosarcina jiandibaonis]|uniref:ABC transporter permease n=1 Tax=Sporosarcina jiandibaonis TaxID=2715535 RepID=UPI0015546581|nr:ABC transporter permease [Sporosarcina jiandibaonis]
MKTEIPVDAEEAAVLKAQSEHVSFGKTIWREIKGDKMAMIALIILSIILLIAYITPFFIDQVQAARTNFMQIYEKPSKEFWLGTDRGGRDIFVQLVIGARNSITIGVAITLIAGFLGLMIGLISGYFGGKVDFVIMRMLDFLMVLPTLMLIIVFVVIVPKFNVWSFIGIMSILLWFGKARLIRSRALAERELDYVNASKTLGTPNWKIMLFEVFPNLSSLVIVNMTLTLAGNIGIETGLTFLGFGLPESTPSLGTLIAYAQHPDVMENKWWVWLPASLLILVVMLCINYIGQAIKRASDARQRLT